MSTQDGKWWSRSWNPLRVKGGGWYCTKISPGCSRCWSEAYNKRFGNGLPFDTREVEFVLDQRILKAPLRWKKPRVISVQWLGDLFHEQIPPELVDDIRRIIYLAKQHIFLVLTKRPAQMAWFMSLHYGQFDAGHINSPNNLWLGVSISTQQEANEKIPILLQTPAAHRFVNIEPMLEEINFGYITNPAIGPTQNVLGDKYAVYQNNENIINWVLLGCESGPGRRPMKLEWARSIAQQCRAAGVNLWIKQLDINGKVSKDMNDWPEDLRVRQWPW